MDKPAGLEKAKVDPVELELHPTPGDGLISLAMQYRRRDSNQIQKGYTSHSFVKLSRKDYL
ncbi:hypothetical protein DAPPUDRAFT_248526 [Daphnia pulex]|uniref:Uncharacterized protein n=1 Tax=Daphnia pulex TaxID=6669 RepID=E9GUU7_DAPPU|nr:hypothetical protein DAPPUDRAFT_248526 [Daphnia pulex]|eukprot:EFX76884.1 hypothetical protein DAPPUDRAFT_248526 [Daphnia pulex]